MERRNSGMVTADASPRIRSRPRKRPQLSIPCFDGDDAMKGLRCVAADLREGNARRMIYIIKDTAKKPDYVASRSFSLRFLTLIFPSA